MIQLYPCFRKFLRPCLLVAFCVVTLALAASFEAESGVGAQESRATLNVNTIDAANQQPAQPPARSTVSGRVVYADTDQPVRRAGLIFLRTEGGGGGRGEYSATTNTRGEFTLRNVAVGSYLVAVNAPGIVSPLAYMMLARGGLPMQSNQMTSLFDAEEVRDNFERVTVDGTSDATVTVRARRGGAIAGRVTYTDGTPAINTQINILRKNANDQFVPFISGFTLLSMIQRTDDRGMYRVASLPPGEYIINASEMNTRMMSNEGERDGGEMMMFFGGIGDALVTTFYPGTTILNEARPVSVTPGSESSEINITLIEPRVFAVGGTVIAQGANRPVSEAQISIRPQEAGTTSPSFMAIMGRGIANAHATRSDEQGRWSLPEIPEGAYIVTVEPPAPAVSDEEIEIITNSNGAESPPARRPRRPQTLPRERRLTRREQTVRVAGADVTNLTTNLATGGRISGTVSIESGESLPQYGTILQLEQASRDANFEMNMARYVGPDGNFVIDGLSDGRFHLGAATPGSTGEDTYYVKAITAPNGVDLLRESINVTGETDLTNVRIVLARGRAALTGRVLEANGDIVRGATVMLVPSDARQWARQSVRVYGQTDWQGNFTVRVPPGEYLLFAGRTSRAINLDENQIRAAMNRATRVTLAPNERRNLDVTAPPGN